MVLSSNVIPFCYEKYLAALQLFILNGVDSIGFAYMRISWFSSERFILIVIVITLFASVIFLSFLFFSYALVAKL